MKDGARESPEAWLEVSDPGLALLRSDTDDEAFRVRATGRRELFGIRAVPR
jgi:hypothetical protein